jgi:hypothetical protein
VVAQRVRASLRLRSATSAPNREHKVNMVTAGESIRSNNNSRRNSEMQQRRRQQRQHIRSAAHSVLLQTLYHCQPSVIPNVETDAPRPLNRRILFASLHGLTHLPISFARLCSSTGWALKPGVSRFAMEAGRAKSAFAHLLLAPSTRKALMHDHIFSSASIYLGCG